MDTVVITACSGRKRLRPARDLHAANLPPGPLHAVAATWLERLRSSQDQIPVHRLYCGRAFAEAAWAATAIGTRLYVASAGLGLVETAATVPSYDLTIAPRLASSVLSRVAESACAADWWKLVASGSHFGVSISTVLCDRADGLCLVALPLTYLAMLTPDLLALPPAAKAGLRLFCGAGPERVAPDLRAFLMPYDARLDGPGSPVRGTRADFAQRALRHFAEHVFPGAGIVSAEAHGAAVLASMTALHSPPAVPIRARRDDDELRALIGEHWTAAEGQSGRLLRLLRDDLGVACEQSRFARLFREMRLERHEAAAA